MIFDKKALSVEEQISLLKERGMSFHNDEKARQYLLNISYYRLSAYWYTFLKDPKCDHIFIHGTTFEKVIDTYIFDRRLRMLIFDEMERIEIALRTAIICNYCIEHGNNWYENKTLYKGKDTYFQKFQQILLDEMDKTNEIFIKHYHKKYTEPPNPPAWMALELVSFGQLSMLYKNLKNCNARKNIAKHFGLDEHVLESWLETLAYIRNACAHHMRLWNRKLPRSPILPRNTKNTWLKKNAEINKTNSIYVVVSIINYLLFSVSPGNSFSKKIIELLEKYPNIPRHYMGFPLNWYQEELWRK